jgi:hypothetical protein
MTPRVVRGVRFCTEGSHPLSALSGGLLLCKSLAQAVSVDSPFRATRFSASERYRMVSRLYRVVREIPSSLAAAETLP